MTLPVNELIGPYQILEQTGTGGMATVYKGYHERLDRLVAIKVMHQIFMQDDSFHARFEREARIVARLEHPNIVPVYDYDDYKGQPYLVMKFIEGQTLKDMLLAGPLSLDHILTLMPKVADALTYAHKQGVLHRDVKPSNIIIDRSGEPYLTDFGLARIAQAGESTLSADMMLGTPQYISPEQAQGFTNIDARTDVYSLGVILYELVTGRVPFTGDTTYAIVHKHIYAAPPDPSQLNADIPPQVEKVLLKALSKEPSQRYDSPNKLMEAFRNAVQTSGLQALDDDRASVAEARGKDISERTPGGSKYVSIPAPDASITPPPAPVSDIPMLANAPPIVQEVVGRLKQAFNDVREELQTNEKVGKAISSLRKINIEIGESSRPRTVKTITVIEQDWGTDVDSIRKRVDKRIRERQGFVAHLLVYLIVIAMLALGQTQIMDGMNEALRTNVTWLADVNPVPLTTIPLAAVAALMWGGGVLSHWLTVFFNSGSRLDAQRRALQDRLVRRHGEDWRDNISVREYKRERRRVEGHFNRRRGWFKHFVGSVFSLFGLLLIWEPVWQMFNLIPGIPDPALMGISMIPHVVVFFMALSLVLHGIGILIGAVAGDDARERAVEHELQKELARSSISATYKAKNEELLDGDLSKPKRGGLRLTEEGEFTDSFMAELEDREQRGGE